MAWFTEGKKTQPAAGDVLADTGAVAAALTVAPLQVVITATLAVTVELRHYDTNGTTILKSHFIKCAANDTIAIPFANIVLDTDQRLKVVNATATLGDVQASLVGNF